MKRVTKAEIRQKAEERTEPLDALINPSDVDSDTSEWSDIDEMTVEDEIAECFAHMPDRQSDSRYSDLVYDLAMELLAESLTRVAMSDLSFHDEKKALAHGYWPNSMRRDRMEDVAYNELQCHRYSEETEKLARIWSDCQREAVETVDAGIAKGLKPEQFE